MNWRAPARARLIAISVELVSKSFEPDEWNSTTDVNVDGFVMISERLDWSRILWVKWLDEVENEVEKVTSEAANPRPLAKRPSTLKTSSYTSFDCSTRFLSSSYCLIYWLTGRHTNRTQSVICSTSFSRFIFSMKIVID